MGRVKKMDWGGVRTGVGETRVMEEREEDTMRIKMADKMPLRVQS